MKLVVFCWLITSSIFASSIDEVRKGFFKIDSKEEVEYFTNLLKDETTPEAKGYYAALLFIKAKYAFFPHDKYRHFNSAKNLLESTINNSPHNVELKYLRFLFQSELPKFLGYTNNSEEDFKYIIDHIEKCELNSNFKKEMLVHMSNSKRITDNQLKSIKLTLKKL